MAFAIRSKGTREPCQRFEGAKNHPLPYIAIQHEEMLRILAAIDKYKNEFPSRGSENARRMQALVLLLRYGGMRIGDTVSLSANRVEENRLLLYTQKTGVPVNNVLLQYRSPGIRTARETRNCRAFLETVSRKSVAVLEKVM